MSQFVDLNDMVFGRWSVLRNTGRKRGTSFLWICKCSCGKVSEKTSSELKKSLSCGCYRDGKSRGRNIKHRIMGGIECKLCSSCKQWISLNNFVKNKSKWDGLNHQCKSCVSTYKSEEGFHKRNTIYVRGYGRRRRKYDLNYRILNSLRSRLWHSIRNNQKYGSTLELIGCSVENLKHYLENKFADGMSWDNYGKWHIDHIIPCASFDLSKPKEQKRCFNYKNLQPLWRIDNIIKGAKIL